MLDILKILSLWGFFTKNDELPIYLIYVIIIMELSVLFNLFYDLIKKIYVKYNCR